MRFYRETSLKDMCLTVIISNFEILFCYSEKWELYDRFLRKKYSQKIYEKLKKNDMLDKKFTNWLISPEWKDVIFEEGYNLSYFVPKFQIYGKLINSVDFKNSSAKVEILSAIVCLLSNVTEMNLSRTNCTDDLLLLIRKMCPLLNSLHLAVCEVSDAGMKNLCYVNQEKVGFPSLKLLDIEETDVKLYGMKYILSNLNLEVLMHSHLELALCVMYAENGYKPREEFKTFNLKHLPLLSSPTSAITLHVFLTMCPFVEKISIMNALKEDDCKVLEKFQTINSLTIQNSVDEEVSPDGLSRFLLKKGYFLTELILDNLIVSVGIIVKTCSNLKKLVLTCVQYQEFDETEIEKLQNLNKLLKLTIRSVDLHQSTNYKSVNLLLKSCKNVEYLTLQNMQNLKEALIDNVASNMPNLIKAKFTYTDINLISAKKLFACENIQYLYLDGCPFVKTEDLSVSSENNSLRHSNTLAWQIEYNSICESFFD